MDNGNGTSTLKPCEYVAQIEGGAKFESLEAAFAAATDGATITLLANSEGNGIIAPQGKFNTTGLTVNFNNFTYTITGPGLAGSTGTKTQAFQLLKDNKITFKNGAIVGNNADVKMMIQNYSDLTLDNMVLDATQGTNNIGYVLSTNNGNTVIKDTKITAKEGGSAFDACTGWGGYKSNNVELTGNSEITGPIEVSFFGDGTAPVLTLSSGTHTGEIVMAQGADKATVTKNNDFVQAAPDGYKWVDNGDGTSTLAPAHYVAQIGDVKYESLTEAVAAAGTAETTITLIADAATEGVICGEGVVVPSGSNITFDLNGLTYEVNGKTVGSTGTETQGFQLLQGSNITFKNGTLKATSPSAQMVIQNYSNLTLENVNIDGTGLSGWAYALSNNCGTINLTGSTSITAKDGGRAFDTCKFGSYAIPTVNINTTGTITGPIEVTGGKLNIENGKFDVTWVTDSHYAAGDIQIKGGVFTAEVPADYCAEGFVCTDNDDETYMFTVKSNEEAGIFVLYDKEPYKYVDEMPASEVTYVRSFGTTNVQSWYVPFEYTVTENDANNFLFYKIHMIAASGNEQGGDVSDNTKVYIYIEPLEAGFVMKANRPYVIKAKNPVQNYNFIAKDIDKLYKPDDTSRLHNETTEFTYDFFGTYGPVYCDDALHWIAISGGLACPLKENTKVQQYRWYIKISPKSYHDDYAKLNFIFVEGDGETDGISAQTIDGEIEGIYTLGGMKVEHPVKGVNIIKYTDGRTKKINVK